MQTKVQLETIGERLEVMRKITNFTKKDICEFLGTTKFIYNEVKWGRKQMPIDWAYKFQEHYRFRLDWIYSGEGEIFETSNLGDKNV